MVKVFPKCMLGIDPQISYEGYVFPCCWLEYYKQIQWRDGTFKDNPFRRDSFNIKNKSIKEILESDEWLETIKNFKFDGPKKCLSRCTNFLVEDGKPSTKNSVVPKIKIDQSKADFKDMQSTDENLYNSFLVDPKNIIDIGFELTSRCSLQCPYCSRTLEAGKGLYTKSDLPLEAVDRSLKSKSWNKIVDCNRYGDSIFYPQYHEFIDLLKNIDFKIYAISTAATGKGLSWWKTTIEKFKEVENTGEKRIHLTFGIDGLKDTSHIHRVGQDFDEIWNAMLMCHDAGLNVKWQFIPFRHNEHQIDEIKQIAKEKGLQLKIVLSNRFTENDPMRPLNSEFYS